MTPRTATPSPRTAPNRRRPRHGRWHRRARGTRPSPPLDCGPRSWGCPHPPRRAARPPAARRAGPWCPAGRSDTATISTPPQSTVTMPCSACVIDAGHGRLGAEERCDPRVGGEREHLLGLALGDDPTVTHDADAVGDHRGLVLVVRDVERSDLRRTRGSRANSRVRSRLSSGSRYESGSSSRSSCGFRTIARASATRCASPPDSVIAERSSQPPEPDARRAPRRRASCARRRHTCAAASP